MSKILNVALFGDSHARYFFCQPHQMRRMARFHSGYQLSGESIPAASVAGFRPKRSTLDTKKKIASALDGVDVLCLAFGQVDLELGYYYRLVVKNDSIDKISYVDWLEGIYSEFLDGIVHPSRRLIIKGVNLTTLNDKQFSVAYVSRIIDNTSPQGAAQKLRDVVLSEVEQNEMHIMFNNRLRAIAASFGGQYFDIIDSTRNTSAVKPRLDWKFLPGEHDHHLADTIATRSIHLQALDAAVERAVGATTGS